MGTDELVDFDLIKKKLGNGGYVLSKILLTDMLSSYEEGYVGAYIFDTLYKDVSELMGKLVNHLIKYEDAVLEADHLVSLKKINKEIFNKWNSNIEPDSLPF